MTLTLSNQERIKDIIAGLIRAADHWHYCNYPEELEFRCEQCQDAEEAMKAAKEFLNISKKMFKLRF